MATQEYTRYRTSRFATRKPLVVSSALQTAEAAQEVYRSKKERPGPKRFSGLWYVRKITMLVILAGIAVFMYAGWTFGYGYYQAKVGQGELRSLFGITGSGSVDAEYLHDEAESLSASINYLDPVGEISIPGIDCRWMIVEGSDDDALTKGPGHIEETQMPGASGNFAVAGDRVLYGAPFLHLDEVAVGDRITVKMPYATFVYKVRETFIVTPDDTSVLQPLGYEAITLLTCDPPWDIKQRIVVRGELDRVLPAGTDA
jgi:sortase A